MLLDVVYVRVVILLNLVFQEEGGLQVLVSQDDEVELELEVAEIAVLQVNTRRLVQRKRLQCLSSSCSADRRLGGMFKQVVEKYELWFLMVVCSKFS